MEHDEEISEFKPFAKEELLPIREWFREETPHYFGARNPSINFKSAGLDKKLIGKFYNWFDDFVGLNALCVGNRDDRLLEPFWESLLYLKQQGVVSRVWALEHRYNDAPAFYRFSLEAAYSSEHTDVNRDVSRPFAHGFAKEKELALSRAIGEFLERYFLTGYRKKNLVPGSYRSLQKAGYKLINLHDFAGFSDEQKKFNPRYQWNEESVFYWEYVTRLSTGEKILIPAQFVYWNYHRGNHEPALLSSNTNGCGGHFTKEKTALSGLYELIQRDAFLIYWLYKASPPKIDPLTVPDDIFQEILRESHRYGFKIHCLNTTLDLDVPSFAVVIEDACNKWPKFTLGGGCEANPAKALRKALEEAWSVYHWMRREKEYSLPENYQPFRDSSVGQNERLRLWSNPKMAADYSFLISGQLSNFKELVFRYPKEFSSTAEELSFLIKRVEGFGPGYEVYGYFPRHPILSKLRYCSAKIIVPALAPLYLTETMAPLGAKRLTEVPRKMGFESRSVLNHLPHPFP